MQYFFLLLGFGLLIAGCGVKAPPVAPERDPEATRPPNLNCSVYDPNCDKEDPNYVPQGKKGKYPSAAQDDGE